MVRTAHRDLPGEVTGHGASPPPTPPPPPFSSTWPYPRLERVWARRHMGRAAPSPAGGSCSVSVTVVPAQGALELPPPPPSPPVPGGGACAQRGSLPHGLLSQVLALRRPRATEVHFKALPRGSDPCPSGHSWRCVTASAGPERCIRSPGVGQGLATLFCSERRAGPPGGCLSALVGVTVGAERGPRGPFRFSGTGRCSPGPC